MTLRLSGWQVLVSLLGVPFVLAGPLLGWPIVTAVGVGCLVTLPLHCSLCWLYERRLAPMPVEIAVIRGEQGRVGFVKRMDGSVVTLQIPDDYNPHDDNGEWLLRQLAPKLFEDKR